MGYPGQSGTTGYQFQSIEVKQTVFRLDVVFLPTEDPRQRPVYFAEIQFQRDDHFGLVELQQTRVYQEAKQEGLEEGLQHKRSLILKQLNCRIGSMSPATQAQIEALSPESLEALGEALLDFSGADDLAQWLKQH